MEKMKKMTVRRLAWPILADALLRKRQTVVATTLRSTVASRKMRNLS